MSKKKTKVQVEGSEAAAKDLLKEIDLLIETVAPNTKEKIVFQNLVTAGLMMGLGASAQLIKAPPLSMVDHKVQFLYEVIGFLRDRAEALAQQALESKAHSE